MLVDPPVRHKVLIDPVSLPDSDDHELCAVLPHFIKVNLFGSVVIVVIKADIWADYVCHLFILRWPFPVQMMGYQTPLRRPSPGPDSLPQASARPGQIPMGH